MKVCEGEGMVCEGIGMVCIVFDVRGVFEIKCDCFCSGVCVNPRGCVI